MSSFVDELDRMNTEWKTELRAMFAEVVVPEAVERAAEQQ